jgi:hypothetical protein
LLPKQIKNGLRWRDGTALVVLLGRYGTNPVLLNDNELEMVNQYRSLDARGQETIKANLLFEISQNPKLKKAAM